MASMNVMDARRYVKVGQASALVLGLAAAGLWAADVPGLGKWLPPKPEAKAAAPEAEKPSSQAVTAKVDKDGAIAMAERFEKTATVKKPEAKVETVEAPKTVVETPAPAWTYLGPIQEPSRLLALISTGEHQKVLPEGRKYGETTLVSVESDQIIVEDGTGRHTIKRAERGESRVAWIKNMPANTPAVAAGAPGVNIANPELRARMAQNQINTPEQAQQRWRQQMRERRERGQPNGGNGSGGGNGAIGAAVPGAVPVPITGAPGVNATRSGDVVITRDATGNARTAPMPRSDGGVAN